MSVRTHRLIGMGYANSPVTVIAKINGTEVFSGEIVTDVSPPPPLPNHSLDPGVMILTWTAPIDFQGAFDFELTMTNPPEFNGFMWIFGHTANYIAVSDPNDPTRYISGGPDLFGIVYGELHHDEQPGGYWCSQSIQNIAVDGIPTGAHSTRDWPGQPGIRLYAGQTATAQIHTTAGLQ